MVKGRRFITWRNPKRWRWSVVTRCYALFTAAENHRSELYDMLSARRLAYNRAAALFLQPAFMQMVRRELQAKLGDKIKISRLKISPPLTP